MTASIMFPESQHVCEMPTGSRAVIRHDDGTPSMCHTRVRRRDGTAWVSVNACDGNDGSGSSGAIILRGGDVLQFLTDPVKAVVVTTDTARSVSRRRSKRSVESVCSDVVDMVYDPTKTSVVSKWSDGRCVSHVQVLHGFQAVLQVDILHPDGRLQSGFFSILSLAEKLS